MNSILRSVFPILAVFTAVLAPAVAYLRIMYGGVLTAESIVDTLYYSSQTVTTVGYGNWVPAGVSDTDPRIFWVKVLSIPAMFYGTAVFAIVIGVLLDFLREWD